MDAPLPPAASPDAPSQEPTPTPETPQPPRDAPAVAATERASVARALQGREEATATAAMRSWRTALMARIERHKRFPSAARGQGGVVTVAFAIDHAGRLLNVRILRASGTPALDEAALDFIRRSQPFPPPPADLPDRELSFAAPVVYLRTRP